MNVKALGAISKFKKAKGGGKGQAESAKSRAAKGAFASLAQKKFSTLANQVFNVLTIAWKSWPDKDSKNTNRIKESDLIILK